MRPATADLVRPSTPAEELARAEGSMFIARIVGVALAVLQVTLTEAEPAWVVPTGYGLAAFILLGAVVIRVVTHRHADHVGVLKGSAWAGLCMDVTAVMGFVVVYAFDQTIAVWAVMYLLPLEGAIRFGLRGALTVMAAVSLLYVARDLWAEAVYGFPVAVESLTYRLGLGLIIALIAGMMARNLTREREQVKAAYESLQRLDEMKDEFFTVVSQEQRNLDVALGELLGLSERHAQQQGGQDGQLIAGPAGPGPPPPNGGRQAQ
jgi:hypothetical protein